MTRSIDTFILTLFAHGNKVRASSLYQVLKGKRTLSVISHGFLYDYLAFFGLFPEMPHYEFEKSIKTLLKEQLLSEHEGKVMLTKKGKNTVKTMGKLVTETFINGFLYSRNDETFHQTLLFATQVLSEWSHKNTHYLPIETSGFRQMLFKQWLVAQLETQKMSQLVDNFFVEWQAIIDLLDEEKALFLTNQLSGYDLNGKTIYQIGEAMNLNKIESFFKHKEIIHQMLHILEQQENEVFPLFVSLYHLNRQYPYNHSAKQSYELFKQLKNVEATCSQRGIKKSTLEEHLLEFSIIDPDFPFSFFLSSEIIKTFQEMTTRFPSYRDWQFMRIKNELPENYSYFMMRLYQIKRKKGEADAD